MNYIKNEVQNSLNRNEILEVKLYLLKQEKRIRLANALGEINFPKIDSYNLLINKFLTAKHLFKQKRFVTINIKLRLMMETIL